MPCRSQKPLGPPTKKSRTHPKLTTGKAARPAGPGTATIRFSFTGKTKSEDYESSYSRRDQAWTGRPARPTNPGLVLYAMSDGSFAIWDPSRNYWRSQGGVDVQDRRPAYVFDPAEVWDGLSGDNGTWVCNGLIRDWAGWQKENGAPFKHLKSLLKRMSPSGGDGLEPGDLTRISLDDARDMPTIRMPYRQDVAVVHASAGMRRIMALTYCLSGPGRNTSMQPVNSGRSWPDRSSFSSTKSSPICTRRGSAASCRQCSRPCMD